ALGVPSHQADALVAGFTAMLSGGPDAIAGQQQAREIITDHVQHTRTCPAANVTATLAGHPAELTHSQLVEDLVVAIIAGHQTTAYWMTNATRLMLTDDRFTNTFTRGRLPVRQALLEALWEDTPTQIFAGRFTTRPADLGNYRIPPGDLILLGLAAANTDPHIRADTTQGTRGSRAYLSYSHGPHGCPAPAQDLSEIIAAVGIEVLLDRLPDMTLACEPDQLRWQPGVWMRGLLALPVRFTPAPPTHTRTGGVPWI
ncbi:cytochrome P450, partial [Streptomyces sp. NPDC054796]